MTATIGQMGNRPPRAIIEDSSVGLSGRRLCHNLASPRLRRYSPQSNTPRTPQYDHAGSASERKAAAALIDHPEALRILWIDDEILPDDPLVRVLTRNDIVVDVASSGAEGLNAALARSYDLILLDLRLPDAFGLTVLRRLIAAQVHTPVAIVTGYYLEPEIGTDARGLGAATVLYKPLDETLVATVRAIVDRTRVADRPTTAEPPFGIVAASAAMRHVVAWLERIAPTPLAVLLTGETGTGKELVARAVHHASSRSAGPFVPVNCGAIPDGLFESELFGHRKGAFTGALEHTPGLIEAANHGTLFLDEVADVPLHMQVRLLRYLDDGRVRRVGENRERPVDVRVVAATNRSLEQMVEREKFRQDLYFRLAAASCNIPPLRERPDDVEALIRYWLPRLSQQYENCSATIDSGAIRCLRAHRWPGNARELRHVLEHSLCLSVTNVLTERDVQALMLREPADACERPGNSHQRERLYLELEANHWNQTQTARRLGIGRTTLWRWLKRDEGKQDDSMKR